MMPLEESQVEQLYLRAGSLFAEFRQGGGRDHIDEAIVLDRKALELCPPGHPRRLAVLTRFHNHLWNRYNRLGAAKDLEEAIVIAQRALELCQRGHPERSISLSNLAVDLFTRFKQIGIVVDLDNAIVLGREAVELCPPGHPNRLVRLTNIALSLFARFEHLGGMADLEDAIVLGQEALELCPHWGPDRSICLNNLALSLSSRFRHLGRMADLEDAIALGREALELCPRGSPDRSIRLGNLALGLSTRFERLGDLADLGDAIVLGREAVELCPQGSPGWPIRLNNLASCLFIRYKQLWGVVDLDQAIILGQAALQACPPGHPNHSWSVENLALYLCIRFTRSNALEDREDIFNLYASLTYLPHMASSQDLSAAKAWVSAAEHFHHPTTLLAYETTLRLLVQHLTTLPSLPQHLPILKRLASSLAVDAFSACIRSGSLRKAVELLEQGRGVFWNQIARLHSPLDDVVAHSPEGKLLADEYTRLTSLIRGAISSPGPDQHDRVCRLNLEIQRTVTNIRELPGLARFQLPPVFFDLQQAASGGPIIIVNGSQHGCDALVVFVNRDPVHIPLQITKSRVRDLSLEVQALTMRAKKMDVRRDLGLILRELWEEVVFPVVDFLQGTVPAQSRIWWCPTAEFSLLPLHAAGPYRRGQRNLSHIYVSSYTSTLTALIRARRHYPSGSKACQKHFVAIGQANASGECALFSVGNELASIGQRIANATTFTRVEGLESCISRVSEELVRNEWVHFACHGLPDRKHPFESAFALLDGHFTIRHIMQCELKNAEFAYLSACHTTVGDEESPDEVIHLASAMQFAGFRSVIGTMWAVDDAETNKITSMFYEHVLDKSGSLDYTRAAFALNKTMNTVHIPLDQRILYVHIGA